MISNGSDMHIIASCTSLINTLTKMTRTLASFFYGIVITRENLKEHFGKELEEIFKEKGKKRTKTLDDFLDDAKGLLTVQKNLLPKGCTLILSSDHYECPHPKMEDMILGFEIKVVDVSTVRRPTRIHLKEKKRTVLEEFLLSNSIEETPSYIFRAPDESDDCDCYSDSDSDCYSDSDSDCSDCCSENDDD